MLFSPYYKAGSDIILRRRYYQRYLAVSALRLKLLSLWRGDAVRLRPTDRSPKTYWVLDRSHTTDLMQPNASTAACIRHLQNGTASQMLGSDVLCVAHDSHTNLTKPSKHAFHHRPKLLLSHPAFTGRAAEDGGSSFSGEGEAGEVLMACAESEG